MTFGPRGTPAQVAFFERMLVTCPPQVRADIGIAMSEMDLHDALHRLTVPTLVIAGAGISMAIPSAQNAVMNAVATSDLGKASGTFMTMRQLGGVFGLAIAVAVFTGAGSYLSPAAFSDGFVPALTVSAALSDQEGVLTLTDTRGRKVLVPTAKLAYVEIGSPTSGQVGFRS